MHPVIICHGFLGYRNMLLWSMFHKVDTALHESGIPAIRTLVHPTASIQERAQQLKEQIEHEYGTEKPIHIVAHSMGGLDARYLASPAGLNQGHRICTITTLSTPHRGAHLASEVPRWFRTTVSFGAWIVKTILVPGESKDLYAKISENRWDALDQLKKEYLEQEFNPVITNHPVTNYFSFGSVVNPFNRNLVGMIRRFMAKRIEPFDGLNDGMVGIESANWGNWKGNILANHGEIVGLKVIPWKKPCFDHISFILEVIKTLPKYEKE